jgi:hypothetical protein
MGTRFGSHGAGWHRPCHISRELPTKPSRSTAMKFETLMLNSLFATCLVICISTIGSMVL